MIGKSNVVAVAFFFYSYTEIILKRCRHIVIGSAGLIGFGAFGIVNLMPKAIFLMAILGLAIGLHGLIFAVKSEILEGGIES